METSMVMAVDPSLVKSETSEAGIPTAFKDNQALKPYGNVSIGWVSEDWKTADGKPIGIGGDPSGATAEKGRIILETSAKVLVPGLKRFGHGRDNGSMHSLYILTRLWKGWGLPHLFCCTELVLPNLFAVQKGLRRLRKGQRSGQLDVIL